MHGYQLAPLVSVASTLAARSIYGGAGVPLQDLQKGSEVAIVSEQVTSRLRALGQHPGMTPKGQRDCEDAIAEIERLTAELAEADFQRRAAMKREVAALPTVVAERERLRAALDDAVATIVGAETKWSCSELLLKRLRRALAGAAP